MAILNTTTTTTLGIRERKRAARKRAQGVHLDSRGYMYGNTKDLFENSKYTGRVISRQIAILKKRREELQREIAKIDRSLADFGEGIQHMKRKTAQEIKRRYGRK